MITRSQVRPIRPSRTAQDVPGSQKSGLTTSLLATAFLCLLVATVNWPRRWLSSGCAVESLILVYGAGSGTRIFRDIPLWTLLATLNLTYAICSTSWLLLAAFTAVLYPCIGFTCLFQFTIVANAARKGLRRLLKQLHFTRDKIAIFNLPALEINTDVEGLLVVRGLTIELSSLTVVAHGIELGLKLASDIELALHVDRVTIPLLRGIEIGDVFGNVKGGTEMTFADIEPDTDEADDESIFINDTPLLRSATAGSIGLQERPRLRDSLTGGSYIKDSSAQQSMDSVTTLSPDDEHALKQYQDILTEIRTSGLIYQTRAKVRQDALNGAGLDTTDESVLRAAICAELQELPSVPHPPQRSIKVTTLQNLSSPKARRFLHRLPFLLRLLLMPLSYFHPISIESVSTAGSGKWLKALLQAQIFKQYTAQSRELARLERKLSTWLADANFCLQLTEISGQAQVPLSTNYNIETHLRISEIIAHRSVHESGLVNQILRLGGADAIIALPSFLLPHHEHLLPPPPTKEDEQRLAEATEQADSIPKTLQAERDLTLLSRDETTMNISVHGRLPVVFDQSLLNFVAALVKATKVVEFEKEVDTIQAQDEHRPGSAAGAAESPSIASPTTPVDSDVESVAAATISTSSSNATFKEFSRKTLRGLRDGTAKEAMRILARDLNQTTRDGMKKAVVGSIVNDRWIAKIVGRIAATMEQVQGDVGYSGDVPVPLAPYRPAGHLPSKLLP
ncbi:uncharacterized protein HMPREF1541_06225 [Cyphellophora europaea CBS 101466]|uniref:Uncharacterized protein n=1 Tax=Cyphellophora europaea (strain CBS 101466) TaxID=1220924 RepID=W2RR34_CYPE1|nr:uncharacterized protein HMPREF1541_06225 [Cyphellophora europaea CBS 101466]ETN38194.1 hypothetical protein HMPREF1541_06225 [Cyphellophora europaea CBS 101466]